MFYPIKRESITKYISEKRQTILINISKVFEKWMCKHLTQNSKINLNSYNDEQRTRKDDTLLDFIKLTKF